MVKKDRRRQSMVLGCELEMPLRPIWNLARESTRDTFVFWVHTVFRIVI